MSVHHKQAQPVCPHCDHEYSVDDMMADKFDLYSLPVREETIEVTCPTCSKEFWLQGGYRPEYSSAPTEDEL